MKEIIAIIRINKINETKQVLAEAGYIPMTCRKVYGRGRKKVNYELVEGLFDEDAATSPKVLEAISENHRLIPKRFLTMIVEDRDVAPIVKILIDTNQTGNMGDGKIFVAPITDVVRIRTGERGEAAV